MVIGYLILGKRRDLLNLRNIKIRQQFSELENKHILHNHNSGLCLVLQFITIIESKVTSDKISKSHT